MKIEKISYKGNGKANEDVLGYKDNTFWVMDGVSPITDKLFLSSISDASYLVNNMSYEMNLILKNRTLDNVQLLKLANQNVRKKINSKKLDMLKNNKFQPSFTIAILQFEKQFVKINILSDCYVIIKFIDHIEVLTDRRIETISKRTDNVKKRIKKNNIPKEEAKKMILNQILQNREKMNIDYWVGTLDGKAFDYTIEYTFKKDTIEQILMCTDGFFRVFDYHLVSFDTLFSHKYTLEYFYDLLFQFEEKNFKNIKKHDDTTAILLKLKEE